MMKFHKIMLLKSCIALIYLINISKVDGFERIDEEQMRDWLMDSKERSTAGRCPKSHNIECQTDEDCANKIVLGSIDEHCSKCVCWHVPICDVKR